MAEEKEQKGFLKKFGKWAPIIGGGWIVLNIVLPLALLRIPAVQKVLVAVGDKLKIFIGFSSMFISPIVVSNTSG